MPIDYAFEIRADLNEFGLEKKLCPQTKVCPIKIFLIFIFQLFVYTKVVTNSILIYLRVWVSNSSTINNIINSLPGLCDITELLIFSSSSFTPEITALYLGMSKTKGNRGNIFQVKRSK